MKCRRMALSYASWIALSMSSSVTAITLFNSQQAHFFPTDASQSCLAAFDLSLNCDENVQLLWKQTDWVGWNATDLISLCTPQCRSSLEQLKSTVTPACGAWSAPLGPSSLNASMIVDTYIYRYRLACLNYNNVFCLIQQKQWDIPSMPTVTWPTHTNKTYLDWENDPKDGSPRFNWDGIMIPPYNMEMPRYVPYEYGAPTAMDYFYTGGQRGDPNLGWNVPLEYDEYPLEIQCSPCFIERFKLGFEYPWGETYNELTLQIWSNMKANCGITTPLQVHPSLNQSGPPDPNRRRLTWTRPKSCARRVTLTSLETYPHTITNCTIFALQNNVPSASIKALNDDVSCNNLESGIYCLPEPCQTMRITDLMTSATRVGQEPEKYGSISLIQFMRWNPHTGPVNIFYGDVICIGPPGGRYVPPQTTIAVQHPGIYTTTAIHAHPTPSGTAPNCGLYQQAREGDYCNVLALNFSLTFDMLLAMNPDLDSGCSNLQLGLDYCVGLVDGTTATPLSSTKLPPGIEQQQES